MTTYKLDLRARPFNAIKLGTKKIEGRAPTEHTKHIPLDKLSNKDKIIFKNEETGEEMSVKIIAVRYYENVREMLEKEGVENVLSSNSTIEEGIKLYDSFTNYKETIEKFGIYAIEIEPLKF